MARAPLSTYRLQLNPDFDFDAAAQIVNYLADLGVSHVYLSPILQAAPGSTHGYDVVDPSRPSSDLGGEEGYARLTAALNAAGLKQVLDIVPNHMAITGPENRWWWDVLENGPSSLWAGHFDVTWDPPEAKLRNTLLMPILGDHYGRVLDRGEIKVGREGPVFTIRYFDHRLPVSPRTLETILAPAALATGDDDLAFIATAYRRLPAAERTDPAGMAERRRDAGVLCEQLRRLLVERSALGEALDDAVAALNEDVDALDAFLEIQNHRIAFWRTAGRDLDYRRFFDIDTLVGLRVEDPAVFEDTHQKIISWVREGIVDGLRVDHPDGLRDPEGYTHRLSAATGGVWTVVEKILEHGEELPESWPVAGTTGYDRLTVIGGLFVDPAGEEPLTTSYGELTGAPTDVAEVQREAKRWAVRELLAADVNRLSDLLVSLCEGRRYQRDRTRHELHDALQELLAAFSVYRTYVQAEQGLVRPADIEHVEAACAVAAEWRPDIDPDLLRFFADLLLLRLPKPTEAEQEWVMRFQQLTGPAMAKGVEDTTFYRYTRLLALNEVGGDPGRFGVSVPEFHAANAAAQDKWPDTMTTLSTHDTKRSADVRARLSLLSEIPHEWASACAHWMSDSAIHWPGGDPDRHTQHLLFQTLVGAWPLSVERATDYLAKATKEAKVHTTWTEPNHAFDQARDAYVAGVLGDPDLVADIEDFVSGLVEPGRVNALAQALLQLTVPGVPDTYQGSELWDLSLVDPDNRRPVDFELRRALLAEVATLGPAELIARSDEGLPKLRVVREALHLRRRRPELFGAGPAARYEPLECSGDLAGHGVGFTRGASVIVVAPRLVMSLRGGWNDTKVIVPPGSWTDLVTGAVRVGGATSMRRATRRLPGCSARAHVGGLTCASRSGHLGRRCPSRYSSAPAVPNWSLASAATGRQTSRLLWPARTDALSIDGGPPRPDPRSAHQPAGIQGLSRIVDHDEFRWTDSDWAGLDLARSVLYELHIGTFTEAGTFRGAIDRLDHLVSLGVDAIELMPVAEFPGARGWGYDGVDLFAPHSAYGGPDGLKELINAAHAKGLGVILDVVYNHLGPDGNYLGEFGPYFDDRHHTNWGQGINVDGPGSDEVRAFIVDNALMWLRDYHVDGLRLDAVHAIVDESATHILEELSTAVADLSRRHQIPLWLIAESDLNAPRFVRPVAQGGYGLAASWADEWHHALHSVLTGETEGYYSDFGSMLAPCQGTSAGLGLRRRIFSPSRPHARTSADRTVRPPVRGQRTEPRSGGQPGSR